MVSHVALSVSATNSGTRIIALEITACLVQGAIAVDNTLWLTFNIGVTPVVSDACTACSITELIAHCIYTTG